MAQGILKFRRHGNDLREDGRELKRSSGLILIRLA